MLGVGVIVGVGVGVIVGVIVGVTVGVGVIVGVTVIVGVGVGDATGQKALSSQNSAFAFSMSFNFETFAQRISLIFVIVAI
jgi:hypothetical protein